MENNLPFGKKNYQWLIIAVATLVAGFIIMSLDREPFGFGFIGLTLGPLVVVAGFILGLVSILHNPKENKPKENKK